MGDFLKQKVANGPNLNGCYLIYKKEGGVAGEMVIRQMYTHLGRHADEHVRQ